MSWRLPSPLDGENLILEELAAEALAGFDEHEGNLQPGELIHDSSSYLSVTADDEVIAKFVDADVVDHSPPGLHALTVENGDEQPFGHSVLEGENAKINEDGKEFRGVADSAVFNRMRIDDPEKRIRPAQAFEVLVDEHTHQDEAEKENQRQPEAAQEQEHNAHHE